MGVRSAIAKGVFAASVAVCFTVTFAFAQDAYPMRDIHLVVGYSPGSGPDITTRRVAEALRQLHR